MRDMFRKFFQDEFLFHAGLMVGGMQLANFLSLLYHLIVVRILSYEEYGALNALVILALYFSQFAAPFQTALTRFLAVQIGRHQIVESRFLVRRATLHLGLISLIVVIAFAAVAGPFARMQQIGDTAEMLLVGFLIAAFLMAAIPQAFLQGAQLFAPLVAASASSALAKLVVGVGLVWMGYGVWGGLWGVLAGPVTFLVAGYFLAARYFARRVSAGEESHRVSLRPIYAYCLPVSAMLISYTILTNSDVTLVKKFFSPLDAGYYSVAQMVGKIILFLPGAVSIVVFPKAASAHSRRSPSGHLLKKGLIVTSLMCGAGTLLCVLAPGAILRILTGKASPGSTPLVPWFALAMSFYALVGLITSYNISIHNTRFIKYLMFIACAQVATIYLYHPGLGAVVRTLTVISIVSFLAMLFLSNESLKEC